MMLRPSMVVADVWSGDFASGRKRYGMVTSLCVALLVKLAIVGVGFFLVAEA